MALLRQTLPPSVASLSGGAVLVSAGSGLPERVTTSRWDMSGFRTKIGLPTGTLANTFGQYGAFEAIAFSGDGRVIVGCQDWNSGVRCGPHLWDPVTDSWERNTVGQQTQSHFVGVHGGDAICVTGGFTDSPAVYRKSLTTGVSSGPFSFSGDAPNGQAWIYGWLDEGAGILVALESDDTNVYRLDLNTMTGTVLDTVAVAWIGPHQGYIHRTPTDDGFVVSGGGQEVRGTEGLGIITDAELASDVAISDWGGDKARMVPGGFNAEDQNGNGRCAATFETDGQGRLFVAAQMGASQAVHRLTGTDTSTAVIVGMLSGMNTGATIMGTGRVIVGTGPNSLECFAWIDSNGYDPTDDRYEPRIGVRPYGAQRCRFTVAYPAASYASGVTVEQISVAGRGGDQVYLAAAPGATISDDLYSARWYYSLDGGSTRTAFTPGADLNLVVPADGTLTIDVDMYDWTPGQEQPYVSEISVIADNPEAPTVTVDKVGATVGGQVTIQAPTGPSTVTVEVLP